MCLLKELLLHQCSEQIRLPSELWHDSDVVRVCGSRINVVLGEPANLISLLHRTFFLFL